MRKLLTLSALTLALAACSTHTPQSPAVTPTLPACQLVRLQRLPTSVLIVPVVESTRPTIRARYGNGYASGMGGERGVAIPAQGYNHGDPDAVIEEYGPSGFTACQ
ncbi:hypothetical protein [Deinococcus sp. NW-56]|uniref:hypothetical protein n=1 Tax=Deinococcus sp. NW-56 TaxID=2080419 RepID=UPI000CF377A6|nr:hypothetical protein [Deinococcus sp. NW-56]